MTCSHPVSGLRKSGIDLAGGFILMEWSSLAQPKTGDIIFQTDFEGAGSLRAWGAEQIPSARLAPGFESAQALLVDLGRNTSISRINVYSWHSSALSPQRYNLWASDAGSAPAADPADLSKRWREVAKADTFPLGEGGKHGSSINAKNGTIGQYRYLLFDLYQCPARSGCRRMPLRTSRATVKRSKPCDKDCCHQGWNCPA